MRRASATASVCSRCLQTSGRQSNATGSHAASSIRTFRSATPPCLRSGQAAARKEEEDAQSHHDRDRAEEEKEQGAMTRRLAEMAEETMDTGSKSDRKLMEDAGFSSDLKKQLEERIAQSAFRAENQQALSEAEMPAYAGKGTRDQATAQVWTGTENLHDSALRMLDDSHKRLRTPSRIPRIPSKINLRPAPKKNISAADRLAQARDKTSIYAISQQSDLTEKEREAMRKELKERFTPGARPMPTTLQGLTTLANERIEDAIARGQFRNIQRGKGINTGRDYNANSPFIDTTEYFMNKIIQKQEIVPPWIEKQQELVKNVASFRSRLRNDWRRHAARLISSKGGSIDEQVRRAKSYALAEERINPRAMVKVERLSEIDETGTLNTISVEERIAAVVPLENGDKEKEVSQATTTITVTETSAEDAPKIDAQVVPATPTPGAETTVQQAASASPPAVLPMAHPFRDPDWERIELAYHTLVIADLNSLTRSYNLMAPKLAQKPYHTLERELKRCFADVAPLVADEILQRSRTPQVKFVVGSGKEGGVLDGLVGAGHVARVRDEDLGVKGYGFKQFWRDLFRKEGEKESV